MYRYRCTMCGTEFRQLRQFHDLAFVGCPECGAAEVTRLLSQFSVIYKGSGFYKTDSRRARSRTERSSPSTSSSGGEGEGSGHHGDGESPAANTTVATMARAERGPASRRQVCGDERERGRDQGR